MSWQKLFLWLSNLFLSLAKSHGYVEPNLRARITELEARIAELEEQFQPIPPPLFVAEVTASSIETRLWEIFPQAERLCIAQYFADRHYKLTTVAEMNRFLARDDTDLITWKKEAPDCNDFTRWLLGNLTIPGWWSLLKGDVWIYGDNWGHSILITALCKSEEDISWDIYFIEGQTDALELAPEMFEGIKVGLIKI